MPNLPGWNSLQTVARFHGYAEIAGIIFLVFLVLAEILAFKYGHRKDDLIAQEQSTTDQQHNDEIARIHLETAQANEHAANLERDAENARLETAKIKANLSWRNITPEIAKELVSVLSASQHSVLIAFTNSDPEGTNLAIQLSKVFSDAKWTVIPQGRTYSGVVGGIFISDPETEINKIIRNAFTKAKIPFSTEQVRANIIMTVGGVGGDCTIVIGSKIPSF